MAAGSFEFEAQLRETRGTAIARRIRLQEDRIPAVVYGAGKPTVSISLSHHFVLRAFEKEAVFSHVLTLKLPDVTEKVVLKEVARHPSRPRILHIDFLRIDISKKLVMRVPLHFIGESQSPGLKEGGVLYKSMPDLEVSCLPDQLPEYIEVDISTLNMHDAIHLSEIHLPEGVALAHPIADEEHDYQVVSVHEPREEEPEKIATTEEVAGASTEGESSTEGGTEKAEAATGESKSEKSSEKPAASKKADDKKSEAKK